MTMEVFLTLLTVCAIVTGWLVEAIKKFLNSLKVKYVTNVVVLIVSVITGGGVSAIYYILNQTTLEHSPVIFAIVMIVVNWLVAMLGYDKIVQTIQQFKNKTKIEEQ